jgi:dolichyl-phosphate-mannose-protein mannosyltransferase
MMMSMNIRSYLFWGLALISFGTVFIALSSPKEVVFDEVHFGKFVTAYCCTHERIFDIHPPHAKLLIAGTAYMGGYRGGIGFESIGQKYDDKSPLPLRALPALAGALIPLVLYGILRTFNVSPEFAALGGLFAALDNALTTQSRIIGLDTILLLATFGSIWMFLLWLTKTRTPSHQAALLIGSGLAAGLAAGTKFTGAAALGIIGLVLLLLLIRALWKRADAWKMDAKRIVVAGLTVLASAIVVYVVGWVVHFAVLTEPGPRDVWGELPGGVVQNIINEHKVMFDANYNLTAEHSYSSLWWTWPGMQRTVFYWAGDSGAWIYFWGNPFVWWGAGLLFVAALATYVSDATSQHRQRYLWILLIGYFASYLPFMRIPRALFLYHYLTPLLFSILFAMWWVDAYAPARIKNRIAVGMAALIVVGFIIFLPITYGFDGWQKSIVWFATWR